MESLWNDAEAAPIIDSPLALRVYTSRLLGRNPALVLHGGGNTSVKLRTTNLLGDAQEILLVKGSGCDLATIGPEGFAGVDLDYFRRFRGLEQLSDERGHVPVQLDTSQHGCPFYSRYGFKVVCETPDYYAPGLDRYDMVLEPAE